MVIAAIYVYHHIKIFCMASSLFNLCQLMPSFIFINDYSRNSLISSINRFYDATMVHVSIDAHFHLSNYDFRKSKGDDMSEPYHLDYKK